MEILRYSETLSELIFDCTARYLKPQLWELQIQQHLLYWLTYHGTASSFHARKRSDGVIFSSLWHLERYFIARMQLLCRARFSYWRGGTCSWGEVNTLMTIFKALRLRLQRISIYPGKSAAAVKLRHKCLVLDSSHRTQCRGLLRRNYGLPNWLAPSLQHNAAFLSLSGSFVSYLLIIYQYNIKDKAR
jgi:hypothetical protein